jgi:hypothetical protein
MSLGTAIWNFTEYLCYVCIIVSTGIKVWGCFRTGQVSEEAGVNMGIGKALDLVGRLADDFSNTSKGNKKTLPATKKK